MKIPFSIEYRDKIESGNYKVETAGGCPTRIVCWDVNCDLPILALVTINDEKAEERAVGFYADGTNLLDEPRYDKLFLITPETELTEFEEKYKPLWLKEKKIIDEYEGQNKDEKYQQGFQDGKEEALKEFEKKCTLSSDIKHGLAYSLGYKTGKEQSYTLFKSTNPKSPWRPTVKQMQTLEYFLKLSEQMNQATVGEWEHSCNLKSLYEGLKKLE